MTLIDYVPFFVSVIALIAATVVATLAALYATGKRRLRGQVFAEQVRSSMYRLNYDREPHAQFTESACFTDQHLTDKAAFHELAEKTRLSMLEHIAKGIPQPVNVWRIGVMDGWVAIASNLDEGGDCRQATWHAFRIRARCSAEQADRAPGGAECY